MPRRDDIDRSNGVALSVVIPVYRSEDCVSKLVAELCSVCAGVVSSYEIIMVNDCSPDQSWARIEEVTASFPEVIGINLRRNAGQDNALMAGLNHAAGAVIVIMDDDLQHDPRDIPKLLKGIADGADVCYANFREKRQAWWKNLGSWFNGKVAEKVIGKPPHIYLSPFKAIRGDVVREVIRYDGPFPYVDGLLFRVTSNITQVDAEHHERYAGRSNYNLVRSISVWLKLATSFSLLPLRLATLLGLVSSCCGLLLALYFVVRRLLDGGAPMGWPSLIVTMLVLGGVQLGACRTCRCGGPVRGAVTWRVQRRPALHWAFGNRL